MPRKFATLVCSALLCLMLSSTTHADNDCTVEEIATGLTNPFGLLATGNDVLVLSIPQLVRVHADGSVEVLAADLSNGTGITRVGNDVYGLDFVDHTVIRFDRKTWSRSVVASTGVWSGISLAIDQDALIVTTAGDPDNLHNPLLRVKLDGSVEVITDQGLGGPAGVIVDERGYLVTDFIGGRLLRVTRDGQVSVLASNLGNPVELREHGGKLYVSDYAGGVDAGRLLRIELNDTTASVTAIPVSGHLGNPSGMTIKGSDILMTDDPAGRVMRLSHCLD